jgi:NAD(P)-dependent dehydrogenase (short-subunit alcohol dehydrogenase family)
MNTQREKVAVVTGGTDGIGREVARGLARQGLHIVVIGNDPAKGARAAEDIRQTTGSLHVDYLQADLALVREANRVADELLRRFAALDYLVRSAGVVRGRHMLTAEGIETNLAINYLSRFVLSDRLLPRLAADACGLGQAGSEGEWARGRRASHGPSSRKWRPLAAEPRPS